VRGALAWAARLAPVPLGLALSGALVWQASYSAFSATTSNTPNTWNASTQGLSNDSSGPMFAITNMTPGATASKCIKVSSTGTVPATVKLYTALGSSVTNDISQYINLTIQLGTGGTSASCSSFVSTATEYSGTLSALTLAATSYATGEPAGSLTGTGLPETLTYEITYTFSSSAPNSAQGGSTPNVTFTWESQNN
jgi:hypothetical protein